MINYDCDKKPEYFQFITDHFGVKFTEKSIKDQFLKVHALFEEETLVAVLLIKKKKDNQFRITFLRVAEEFKGKRYGHTIVHLALQDAYKENKAPIKVLTRVKASNIDSLNFFYSGGFKIDSYECSQNTVIDKGSIITEIKPAYILNINYNEWTKNFTK